MPPPAEAIEPPVSDPIVAPISPIENQDNAPSVSYGVASSWDSGLTGNMTIQNTGAEAINGWTLEFTYAGDIQSIWGAEILSRDGDKYVITNLDWNSSIAPGAESSFGFTAAANEKDRPMDVILNGETVIL